MIKTKSVKNWFFKKDNCLKIENNFWEINQKHSIAMIANHKYSCTTDCDLIHIMVQGQPYNFFFRNFEWKICMLRRGEIRIGTEKKNPLVHSKRDDNLFIAFSKSNCPAFYSIEVDNTAADFDWSKGVIPITGFPISKWDDRSKGVMKPAFHYNQHS